MIYLPYLHFMIVLVTGANGFLGYYLTGQLLEKGYEVIATGLGECRLPFVNHPLFRYEKMDITDPFSVHDVFSNHKPAVVVHAAAMSKPDECEKDQWGAYVVNVEGTVTTLLNAAEQQCFFIFISTDFVFDGATGMYSEEDKPNPVNYYGKTKLEAEEAVAEYAYDWAIVRTVMVYGKPVLSRSNILSIVKEKLERRESYKVVDDQVRTPTYVGDLADGIVSIIQKRATGIFHISGAEVMTPYQMASRAAAYLNLDGSHIQRVTAADFSQPARRPAITGLNIDKAKDKLGFEPHSFEEGLRRMFS
jgi:dTDP-4-dehydrorhamnose reductase